MGGPWPPFTSDLESMAKRYPRIILTQTAHIRGILSPATLQLYSQSVSADWLAAQGTMLDAMGVRPELLN